MYFGNVHWLHDTATHKGISHRTGNPLNKKEKSNVRDHSLKCKTELSLKNFKILGSYNNEDSLTVAESLFLKVKTGDLNSDTSSTPLYIA